MCSEAEAQWVGRSCFRRLLCLHPAFRKLPVELVYCFACLVCSSRPCRVLHVTPPSHRRVSEVSRDADAQIQRHAHTMRTNEYACTIPHVRHLYARNTLHHNSSTSAIVHVTAHKAAEVLLDPVNSELRSERPHTRGHRRDRCIPVQVSACPRCGT